MIKIRVNSDGVITGLGSGLTDYTHTEDELADGVDPESIDAGKYKWNGGDPQPIPQPPSPDEAFQKINQYFIEVEGSTDAGLDRVDSLMSKYPSVDRAVANKNYDIVKNRMAKANSDGMLTDQELSDLSDIVDGVV